VQGYFAFDDDICGCMYLRVGSSSRTGTDDQITVRKSKCVSASGAHHTRDRRCGRKQAREIVSSRPDPAPSQTSPPLTGIGGGFSICASMGCMPPTPEMMWRCVSSMSDCTIPTGQPAALAKSPSIGSEPGDRTDAASRLHSGRNPAICELGPR
jgi:hypothetical protein